MVRFEDYRLFREVALAESFSDAARISNVSQSSISKRIGRLEQSLKTRLFDRTNSRAARLTTAGVRLQKVIEEILEEVESIPLRLSETEGEQNRIILAVDDLVPMEWISRLLNGLAVAGYSAQVRASGEFADFSPHQSVLQMICGWESSSRESALTLIFDVEMALIRSKSPSAGNEIQRLIVPRIPQHIRSRLHELVVGRIGRNVIIHQVPDVARVQAMTLFGASWGLCPVDDTFSSNLFELHRLNEIVSFTIGIMCSARFREELLPVVEGILKRDER